MDETTDRQFEEPLFVDDADQFEVDRIAKQYGVEVRRLTVKGMDTLSLMTVILAGSSLSVATVVRLIDEIRGGQIIDMRPKAKRRVYRSRDIQLGLIIVVADDGRVILYEKDVRGKIDGLFGSLKAVAGGAKGSNVQAIAEVAKRELGEGADVQTESGDTSGGSV